MVLPTFLCPGDDLARLTGAQNGPDAKKNKKTPCFSQLFMQKSRKLYGFAYFLVPPSTTSPGSLGPRMAQALKNQNNSMLFITFYAKIKKTRWFYLLFSAPVDNLTRLTGLTHAGSRAEPGRAEPTHAGSGPGRA